MSLLCISWRNILDDTFQNFETVSTISQASKQNLKFGYIYFIISSNTYLTHKAIVLQKFYPSNPLQYCLSFHSFFMVTSF